MSFARTCSLFVLLKFLAAAVSAANSDAIPELRGAVVIDGQTKVSIYNPTSRHGAWVEISGAFEEWRVVAYEPKTEIVTIDNGRERVAVPMFKAKIESSDEYGAPLSRASALRLFDRMYEPDRPTTLATAEDLKRFRTIAPSKSARLPLTPQSTMRTELTQPLDLCALRKSQEETGFVQIADIGTEQHPVPFFLKPLRLEDLPYELSANLTQADLDALRAKQELYALRGFGAVMERQIPPANADKTEANKLPDPTPASGTPAAGASVAPPPGAGHS